MMSLGLTRVRNLSCVSKVPSSRKSRSTSHTLCRLSQQVEKWIDTPERLQRCEEVWQMR